MRNIFKQLFHLNGSVLVFSIIILAIILVTSLSVISVSIIEHGSTKSSSQSVQAFNIAQSCVETTLKAIKDSPTTNSINSLRSAIGGTCNNGQTITLNVAGGSAALTVNDATGTTPLNCSNTTTDKIADIGTIRCVGTTANTSRAIETAVAAGTSGCRLSVNYNNGSSFTISSSGTNSTPISISVTGANVGDAVVIGYPPTYNRTDTPNICGPAAATVSSNNTVKVQFWNSYSSSDCTVPSGNYTVCVN